MWLNRQFCKVGRTANEYMYTKTSLAPDVLGVMRSWKDNRHLVQTVRLTCSLVLCPATFCERANWLAWVNARGLLLICIIMVIPYSTYYEPMGDLPCISSEQGGRFIIRTWLIYEFTISVLYLYKNFEGGGLIIHHGTKDNYPIWFCVWLRGN